MFYYVPSKVSEQLEARTCNISKSSPNHSQIYPLMVKVHTSQSRKQLEFILVSLA